MAEKEGPRKAKKSSAKRGSHRKRSAKVFGPLMVVDQKPFLKKALARCQRIRRDLAKRQKELSAFEEGDVPAYQAWIATEFGALLTQLREDHEAVAQLDAWLYLIDFSQEMMGVPQSEVYEYVRKHREDPDYWDPRYDPDPKEIEAEDEAAAAEFEEMDDEERAMFEDFMKGIAEDVFGIDADELEKEPGFPGWSEGSAHHKPAPSAVRKREASELKQLYRRLARRLHPDVNRAGGAVAERRWEQLQAAYEAENLDKLRALEAICDADETGLSIKLGLAHLNTWADYHHMLLKPLQSTMREAKKHPAWGFATLAKKERSRYKKATEAELEHDRNMLQSKRLYLENMLDSYRKKAKNNACTAAKKQPKKKKAKPQQKP